ncbi:MAG: hypothetical protein QM661_10590 [Solimonas sp.]
MGRGHGGKQKLIQAALDLAASTRSLASLGIREVTRRAGLAPNAFYRRFRDFDQLGLEVIDLLGTELRRGLRERRLQWKDLHPDPAQLLEQGRLADIKEIIRQSVELVLEFVAEHHIAYTVGIHVLHGTSPTLRTAMEHLLEQFAADMADDVQPMLVELDSATTLEISREVIRQMSFFSMDYLQGADQRQQVRERAERFILRLFAGELALHAAEKAADGNAAVGTSIRASAKKQSVRKRNTGSRPTKKSA